MSKLLEHIKSKYKIVVIDTEFQSDVSGSYCTKALCAVYKDLSTDQTFKIWDHGQNNSAQHHFDFETTLFVCHYATAEVGYFLKQLMGRPPYIFDTWTEYSKLYKKSRSCSLRAAAIAYAYPNPISQAEKDKFRDMCIKQNTWSEDDKNKILNYCEGDVLMNEHIFYKILNDLENACGNDYDILLEQAMARGQAMACYAKINKTGIPVDTALIQEFNDYWQLVKSAVIQRFNKDLGLWDENSKFSNKKFSDFIHKLGLQSDWPRTPHGKFKTDKNTYELFDDIYPEVKKLKRISSLTNATKLVEYTVSEDGRYRPHNPDNGKFGFGPFGTITGRCNPTSKWFFGSSKWSRGFMKPSYGHALAYLDFASQETFVGAKLSGDKNMEAAYDSGDIYFGTAVLAGMATEADRVHLKNYKDKVEGRNSTPLTKKEIAVAAIRKIWKVIVLASNYGQGARGMAKALIKFGKTYSETAGLLMRYKEVYKTYFDWTVSRTNHAQAHGYISTSMGWDYRFPQFKLVNPRSLMNWSIQAEAAEVLRNALIRITNANIKVCATVHDAILIECPLQELHEQIAITKQHMIDATTCVLDKGIRVDATIHYSNYKQENPSDQKIFDTIFDEIKNYKSNFKSLKHGQDMTLNMVRGANITL